MALTERLALLMTEAVQTMGLTDAIETLSYIEERLTLDESEEIEAFFKWLIREERTFGHRNIASVWNEHQKIRHGQKT